MQQVGHGRRFWWRVQDARSPAPSSVPPSFDGSDGSFWHLPSGQKDDHATLTGPHLSVTPADRPLSPRPRRKEIRRTKARFVVGAALLATVAIVLAYGDMRDAADRGAYLAERLTAAASAIGFGIDEVSVTGQVYTGDADILDQLDLVNVRTVLALDSEAARVRIERLPWVATARLSWRFPGGLDVEITEREPFARWTRGTSDFLIDDTGRVLAPVQATFETALLRVSGEGAADEAAALASILERYPQISRQLKIAERIGERRWALTLANGTHIGLAPEREADGLNAILADKRLVASLTGPAMIIDTRAPGRVTIRPAPPAQLASISKSGAGN